MLIRFQFLIGRLVTIPAMGIPQEYVRFQFLIGRLVTNSAVIYILLYGRFQFLIGRLVTFILDDGEERDYRFNSS